MDQPVVQLVELLLGRVVVVVLLGRVVVVVLLLVVLLVVVVVLRIMEAHAVDIWVLHVHSGQGQRRT